MESKKLESEEKKLKELREKYEKLYRIAISKEEKKLFKEFQEKLVIAKREFKEKYDLELQNAINVRNNCKKKKNKQKKKFISKKNNIFFFFKVSKTYSELINTMSEEQKEEYREKSIIRVQSMIRRRQAIKECKKRKRNTKKKKIRHLKKKITIKFKFNE